MLCHLSYAAKQDQVMGVIEMVIRGNENVDGTCNVLLCSTSYMTKKSDTVINSGV